MLPPKTRIQIIEKNNGEFIYIPQVKIKYFARNKYWIIFFPLGLMILLIYWSEGTWRKDGGLFWDCLYTEEGSYHEKCEFDTQKEAEEIIDRYLKKLTSGAERKRKQQESEIANKPKKSTFVKYP